MPPSPSIAHHLNALSHGGAAIAAMRIAEGLRNAGCAISFWTQQDASREPLHEMPGGTLYYAKPHRWLYARDGKKHRELISKNPAKTKDFSLPFFSEKPKFDSGRYGDGVLHLHWIGGKFFDYEAFLSSIPDDHPIVWTLHDLNPLTGGCHYTGTCRGFEKTCGNCPQLVEPSERDITRRAMETKLRVLRGKNLHLVANSHWTETQARASSIGSLAKSIRTIHYPLDLDVFSPLPNRLEARHILGIPTASPVITFGAIGADDPRKGLIYLIKALKKLRSDMPFHLLVFGNSPPEELKTAGIVCHCMGRISHLPMLRMIYGMADLCVMPSLEEALGQVGMEAMACGTPVVAFNTGGIPDFVKHGETGLLAPTGDADALAARIKEALANPLVLQAMRIRARQAAVELFAPNQQAQKYLDLYTEIYATPIISGNPPSLAP